MSTTTSTIAQFIPLGALGDPDFKQGMGIVLELTRGMANMRGIDFQRISQLIYMLNNGAWLEVKNGGSLFRIALMAAVFLNSLDKNSLTRSRFQPWG